MSQTCGLTDGEKIWFARTVDETSPVAIGLAVSNCLALDSHTVVVVLLVGSSPGPQLAEVLTNVSVFRNGIGRGHICTIAHSWMSPNFDVMDEVFVLKCRITARVTVASAFAACCWQLDMSQAHRLAFWTHIEGRRFLLHCNL